MAPQAGRAWRRRWIVAGDLVLALVWRMVRARYLGTAGGIVWLFVQPLTQIVIYWVVFSVGFRVTGPSGEPYILFFVTGFVPWVFFQEAMTAGSSAITAAPHLVRKTAFPTILLPPAAVFSAAVTHCLILPIVVVLLTVSGRPPPLTIVATAYYLGALTAFTLGLAWIAASLQVYFRDIGQILAVVLGAWFWLTPVAWPPSLLEEVFSPWMTINPLTYIVNGYRDSLLLGRWPTLDLAALVFWAEALASLALGRMAFHRLRGGFAEVI